MKLTKNSRVVRSAAFLAMMCGRVMTARGQAECPLQWVPSPQQGVPGWTDTDSDYFASTTIANMTQWSGGSNGPRRLLLSGFTTPFLAGNLRLDSGVGWDGNRWVPIPTLRGGGVYHEHAGELYIGGNFLVNDPSLSYKKIARWTGTDWQVVGNGLSVSGYFGGFADAIGSFEGELIAAGSFRDTAGVQYQAARWDGAAWHVMPFASQTFGGPKRQFVQMNGELFLMIQEDITAVWRWDGSLWRATPLTNRAISPIGARLFQHGGQLYASGAFRIEGAINATLARWTGESWERIDNSTQVYPVASTAYGILGMQSVPLSSPASDARLYLWDGAQWQMFGPRFESSNTVWGRAYVTDAMMFGDDLIVLGTFRRVGDLPAANIVRWDGQQWYAMGSGFGGSPRQASTGFPQSATFYDAASYGDTAIVAGTFGISTPSGPGMSVASWDGAAWSHFGIEETQIVAAGRVAVDGTRIAVYGSRDLGNCCNYVVGLFDGQTWSTIPEPTNSNGIRICFHNGQVVAAINGFPPVVSWNGTAWQSLQYPYPIGIGGSPWYVASIPGYLVVFGQRTQGGSLLTYDGSSWTNLDVSAPTIPAPSSGCNIGVYQNQLLLYGVFSSIAGVPANNIVLWDGTSWRALGEGRPSRVRAIASQGENLYTIEDTGILATPSRISRWDGTVWTVIDVTKQMNVIAATEDGVLACGPYAINSGISVLRHCKYYAPSSEPQLSIEQATVTSCADATTQLTLHAAGAAPFDFHWFLNNNPVDLSSTRIRSRIDPDERTIRLIIDNPRAADQGLYTCVVSNFCSQTTSDPISLAVIGGGVGACDAIDFNNDCAVTPTDIEAFLSVYGEGPCIPADAACNDIDFNNDGSVFDPIDMDAFFSVYSEGPCF